MENTTLEKKRQQLSEIIQRSRVQKGLSQEKLAEKVGCVRSTIDRLEKQSSLSIQTYYLKYLKF
jgi:Helix-turn-helix.